MENPQFLIQQSPRLSIKESENIIDELLKRLNILLPPMDKHKLSIISNKGTDKEEVIKYIDLVKQIRKSGTCIIQIDLDRA